MDPTRISGWQDLGDAGPFVERMTTVVQHIKMFEDFDRADMERMAPYMRCYRVPAGTEVIREGEQGDFMILLLDGEMEIVRRDATGMPARMALAGPGKTLGEMSLIDGEPRFASCLTLTRVTFALLDREGLSRIVANEPQIGVKLLMELLLLLNQRLRTVSRSLLECMTNRRLRVR